MRDVVKQKIDRCSIERANGEAKGRIEYYVKKAELLTTDPDFAVRLAGQKCLSCHYLPGLNGNAIQTVKCAICEATYMRDRLRGDPICSACAKENGLCRECGSDIDLKSRRKPYRFEKKNNS